MSRKLVNYADVARICVELVEGGETPSTIEIFKQLKRGSYTTIQTHLRKWMESDEGRSMSEQPQATDIQVPEQLQREFELMAQKSYRAAMDEATGIIEQMRQERDQATAQARAEIEEALKYADSIGNEVEMLREQNSSLANQLTDSQTLVGNLNGRITELEKSLESNQRELKTTTGEIETLAILVDDLEKKMITQEHESTTAIKGLEVAESRHKTELAKLTASHKSEIERLASTHERSILVLEKTLTDAQQQRDKAVLALDAQPVKRTRRSHHHAEQGGGDLCTTQT